MKLASLLALLRKFGPQVLPLLLALAQALKHLPGGMAAWLVRLALGCLALGLFSWLLVSNTALREQRDLFASELARCGDYGDVQSDFYSRDAELAGRLRQLTPTGN